MRDLANNLTPGTAALFVLVDRATADTVIPQVATYGGRVLQSSLSAEQETVTGGSSRVARASSRARGRPR